MIIPGILSSGISGHLTTSSFESISTVLVGSGGASSITLNSGGAWSDYKHLQLRCSYKLNSGSQYITLKLNGDSTSSHYSFHFMGGEGTNPAFAAGAGNMMPYVAQSSSGANNYAFAILDFLDFGSTTKNKTVKSLFGQDRNGSGDIAMSSGAWYNSSDPITSITLTPNYSAVFSDLSQFSIYGIKD